MIASRSSRVSTVERGTHHADSRAFLALAIAGTLPLIVLPFVAIPQAQNYRYSAFFLVPLLWGTFASRRRLHLHPLHFAMFALALVLHGLGALGFYQREFAGLAFDTYVHFYFGLVGGLLLERTFRLGFGLRGSKLAIQTLMFIMGLSAVHELVEIGSTLVLGQETGMYKMGNADELDTHKDMANGGLGALTALAISAASRRRNRHSRA